MPITLLNQRLVFVQIQFQNNKVMNTLETRVVHLFRRVG